MPSAWTAFAVTAIAFVIVDVVWLSLVALPVFRADIGVLLRPAPDLAAALAFYVLYVAGLVFLAVRPGVEQRSTFKAAALGAILGATAYGTFELTSMAVLKGWTWRLVVMDIVWGMFVSALAAAIGCAAGLRASNR
jgi:uncharacterized membrane protein